jgi:hypothetical protein
MVLFYLFCVFIIYLFLKFLYDNLISKKLRVFFIDLRYKKEYSGYFNVLKKRLDKTNFDEIQKELNYLKVEVQEQQKDLKNIKKHNLSNKQTELEKYLTNCQFSEFFLVENGTHKRTSKAD